MRQEKNIKDYIISEGISILEAMNVINKNARGVAYLCEGMTLKGVVTDGNIRRYILENGDVTAPIAQVTNFCPKSISRQEAANAADYMKEHNITSVPVLNGDKEIVAIKFLYGKSVHKAADLNIPVIIMAGGKGTRLQPYTKVLPKPLIPVGDKTITELIMKQFAEFGCREFDLIVNYKKNLIKAFFEGEREDYRITFTDETEFMGTAGGLALLRGKYTSTFFMTNCDILIEEEYGEIYRYHKEKGNLITVVSALKNITIPYGAIEVSEDGRVERINEKPNFSFIANTGFYVIEPAFLDYIPQDTHIHITEVMEQCIADGGRVGVYPVSEKAWFDMGEMSELEKMRQYQESKERNA